MTSAEIQFFDDLKVHLANCSSPDPDLRTNAESQIRNMRDTDVKKFLASLVKEISDDSNPENTRLMACVVGKNLISNKSGDKRYSELWVSVEPFFKQSMKEAVLANLACPLKAVRTQIASFVSAIAAIEIPRGEWLELITMLCTNATHTDEQVKLASLQTIGFICEELQPSDLTPPLRNAVLNALVTTINKDEGNGFQASLIATKALLSSIAFAQDNFQDLNVRNFIMQKIFEALEIPDVQVREYAMQTLVELVYLHYDFIEFYLPQIAQATYKAANSDESQVGMQGIEFWTSLTEEEIKREKNGQPTKNYIKNAAGDLIQLMLQNVVKVVVEDDEEEDDETGVQQSAGVCLQRISLHIGSSVLPPVVEFVSANILSQDWKLRYAAVISLGTITEGPDRESFNKILIPSLESLLKMYQDPSIRVRSAISWLFGKICEHYADIMTQNDEVTRVFVQTLITSLQDRPKVSEYSCVAIEKLAESLQPTDPETMANKLSPFFDDLARTLLTNASRECDSPNINLINSSYAALISLVQHSCKQSRQSIFQMLMPFLGMLEQTVGKDSANNQDTQNMIFCLLQVILVKVGSDVSTEIGEKIVQLIIIIFQALKRVSENGLIAYIGLCSGLKERVNVKDFGQYILWALDGDDEDCARVACGIISDIASALEENVHTYLTSFVPSLLKVLVSNSRNKSTKLHAMQSLGDLAIYAPTPYCQIYMRDTLQVLQQAADVSNKRQEVQNDPELSEFLTELKRNVLQLYSTLTTGAKESNMQKDLLEVTPALFQFMQNNMLDQEQSLEIFQLIAGLLGDLADCLGSAISQLLNQQWIVQLLQYLVKSNDQEIRQVAQWSMKTIQKAVTPSV